jgi:hypothetical protein
LKQGEVIRESTTYDDYLLSLESDATNGMDDLPDDEEAPDDNTGVMAQIRSKLGL